ncbi:FAD-dependent oxidoreductase [Natronorubrum sp. JWXQ-INN-674]|uniref:FAD-dependent oxidoreductase n=1 Tax=Natronorubrum halalkaliphilum TaxID=2691917 RepID=A0A6B0VMR4_9EURY|nr:FAD-dependent oxidoreductase [Natronorubrum halalkaliphilum]MXV62336.1 FAD-dependent oxidoreductase [Natronorubrum halalkaliphilum]
MDIVIVGGGIVGTAIAARLGETEHDVALVERSGIGTETTAASAGILMETVIDPTPFDLRFRERARSVYDDLFERSPLESTRVGVLYVAETATFADRLEESAATLSDRGLEASYLPADELSRLGVDPDGFVGGLYTPNDALCDPTAVANWFADCARQTGVEVRTEAAVTDIVLSEGAVSSVETDTGRLDADCVINATGPWAPAVNELVDVSLPLRQTLGPMVALESDDPIESPVTILESKRYVRPTGGADGTGAWVGEYRTGYDDGQRYDPDEAAVPDGFADSARALATVVPALEDASVADEWVGLRTVTPDGRPIVGETNVDGFVVACGMTGQGITLAPAVADVVYGVLEEDLAGESRDRLSPDRF